MLPLGRQQALYGSTVFFWRQEFSLPLFSTTQPFLTRLSYPLKLPLQRSREAFFILFYSSRSARAPLLSGRNNASFSSGIDEKCLLFAELYWPVRDTCHIYVSCWPCLSNSLCVTLYHIFSWFFRSSIKQHSRIVGDLKYISS